MTEDTEKLEVILDFLLYNDGAVQCYVWTEMGLSGELDLIVVTPPCLGDDLEAAKNNSKEVAKQMMLQGELILPYYMLGVPYVRC